MNDDYIAACIEYANEERLACAEDAAADYAALTERVRVLTDVIRKMCDEVAHTSGLRNEYQDWNAFWEISETALHPPPAQAGQAEGG